MNKSQSKKRKLTNILVPTGIGLSPALLKTLRVIAKQEQRSISQVVRLLCVEAIAARSFQKVV